MSNRVEYVRDICKKRKIAISTLEKECGFSNGYLNPKKLEKIPYERAILIAEYLNIPLESILNDPDTEKAPTLSDERNVTDDEIKFALFGGSGDITDAMYEEVKRFAAYVRQREAENKE